MLHSTTTRHGVIAQLQPYLSIQKRDKHRYKQLEGVWGLSLCGFKYMLVVSTSHAL